MFYYCAKIRCSVAKCLIRRGGYNKVFMVFKLFKCCGTTYPHVIIPAGHYNLEMLFVVDLAGCNLQARAINIYVETVCQIKQMVA